MAILAALLAFGSRFAAKILTTALGWASTLLFGRVPASRQFLLLGITFGSVIWMVLLVGVLVPDVGTFLLVLVPSQDLIPEGVIRLIMLVAALIVPAVIGGLTLALTRPAAGGRRNARSTIEAVLRGYPLTVLLAVLLVFLAGLAIYRKARSLARGRTDAHVPLVVMPGAYDQVASDLDIAVSAVGLEVEPTTAPAAMSKPARWLAAVGGTGSAGLVPERMIQLIGKDLDILIYPMDLLISGKPELVARARAAMASRLTTSAAHLTVSAEAQAIEDRLMALARPRSETPDRPAPFDDVAIAELAAIDDVLAEIRIPYEEWEVLYRQRLQVERDLRAGAMAGEAVVGAATPGDEASLAGRVAEVARLVRSGATAVLDVAAEVAADDETVKALDGVAGPRWSWAVRLASIGADAAQSALRDQDARDRDTARDRDVAAENGNDDQPAAPTSPMAALQDRSPAP